MSSSASQNEGFQILDEFVCPAVSGPSIPASPRKPEVAGREKEGNAERIYTRNCTAEQCEILTRNALRYARIGNAHVRVLTPSSEVSVQSPRPVRYAAAIEVLQSEVAPRDHAAPDAVAVIVALFGSELG